MNCAYCSFAGHRRAVHAHLDEAHAAEVRTRFDEETTQMFFELSCPKCDQTMEKRVKPRWRDPSFLEEFSREIRLVAFDLLLYHLEDHEPHPEASTGDATRRASKAEAIGGAQPRSGEHRTGPTRQHEKEEKTS